MPFVENFLEFRTRMNCPFEQIEERLLFQNGGQSNGKDKHVDPPSHRWTLLRLKREFISFRLKREVGSWTSFRDECVEQLRLSTISKMVPPPPSDATAQLDRGKQRIANLQQELNSIDEQLLNAPENIAKRRQLEAQAESAAKASSELRQLSQMTL